VIWDSADDPHNGGCYENLLPRHFQLLVSSRVKLEHDLAILLIRFLLDTATLNVLSHYRGVPALGCWNAQVV
jgi:hypothetical protein